MVVKVKENKQIKKNRSNWTKENITLFTGSGASFGSGSVLPYPPPLGYHLYNELEQFAPDIMSNITKIVGDENKFDFETKMHEIMESKKINASVLNAVIASYFARFRLGMFENYYVELFRNLLQENIRFVYSTLNYDCLAELAASEIGRTINYQTDNMPTDQFNILKLHGSCNFLLGGIRGKLGSITLGGGAGIDAPIEIVQPNQVQQTVQNRVGPCMSYYMKNKPTALGNKTIQTIQKKWREIINNSGIIVIIGTNVNREDSHIWEPISKTQADIAFVGDENSFLNLQSLNSKIDVTHIGTKFENSVLKITEFLK